MMIQFTKEMNQYLHMLFNIITKEEKVFNFIEKTTFSIKSDKVHQWFHVKLRSQDINRENPGNQCVVI